MQVRSGLVQLLHHGRNCWFTRGLDPPSDMHHC
jgi:hypothetical protein